MITIEVDTCVWCGSESSHIKKTDYYKVGLCEEHKDINGKDIDDLIGKPDEPLLHIDR